MVFEPNQGQVDPRVRYLSRGPGYTLLLTDREALFAIALSQKGEKAPPKRGAHASCESHPLLTSR